MSSTKSKSILWAQFFNPKKNKSAGTIDLLKENILFSTLTYKELLYLSNFVYERTYEAKESVFKQNDRGFGMYIITRGLIGIKQEHTGTPSDYILTLGKGEFFGELSLIDTEALRSASATAIEPSTLIGLFKPDLMEIVERKPTMGIKILLQLAQVLGQRLVESTDRISELENEKLRLNQQK